MKNASRVQCSGLLLALLLAPLAKSQASELVDVHFRPQTKLPTTVDTTPPRPDPSQVQSGRDEIAIEEVMPEEQINEKLRVCGQEWLFKDSADNFQYDAYNNHPQWYPGRARILADPHEALLAKLLLIQKAKKTIDISTYIFSDDETSRAIIDELRSALHRGVNIRFMMDEVGSLSESLIHGYLHIQALLIARQRAVDAGEKVGELHVVAFHPVMHTEGWVTWWREYFLKHIDDYDISSEVGTNPDHRSHDKIFMIDREDIDNAVAIVGGRNIDNSYFGYPKVDEKTYEDMEMIVMNDRSSQVPGDTRSLGTTLGQHFDNLFCSRGNLWLNLQNSPMLPMQFQNRPYRAIRAAMIYNHLDGAADVIYRNPEFVPVLKKMRGATGYDFLKSAVRAPLIAANEIQNVKRTISDSVVTPDDRFNDKRYNVNSIYYEIRRLTGHAENTIDICTPYIFLPPNERAWLKDWVMKKPGRKVRILSNSAATSDSSFSMATFDFESAPEMVKDEDYSYDDPATHQTIKGHFINKDENGNDRIEVYELGRLDNIEFKKGEVYDKEGKLVEPKSFYGKLHAKYMIVDGRKIFIGSHNLDERSRHLNSETGYFADNAKLGADLTVEFEKMLKRSYKYGDRDLEIMNSRPELRTRRVLMTIGAKVCATPGLQKICSLN